MRRVRVVRFVRFERDDGSWREVSLDRASVTVREGFVDAGASHGTSQQRSSHPTEATALAAFEALAEGDGWPRRTIGERELPALKWHGLQPGAVSPEHERALDAADDRAFGAAARVYTDWLVGEGDPRGELAAHLQANGVAGDFLAEHGEALLGELAAALDDEIDALEWHGGLLRKATLRGPVGPTPHVASLEALTSSFLALPIARFLNRLRFGNAMASADNDWAPTLAAVADSERARFLRELAFDSISDILNVGDLSGRWDRFEALETLSITGTGCELGAVELPRLERFVRIGQGLSSDEFDSIVRARWPRLGHLEISTGLFAPAAVREQFPSLLENPMPRLTHFGLSNCQFGAEALRLVVDSKLFANLTWLDFTTGELGDSDVDLVLSLAPKLRRLRWFDLSRNRFSADAERELKAALPHALLNYQR